MIKNGTQVGGSAQVSRSQQFIDSNVEGFARTVPSLAASNGIVVKARAELGPHPAVHLTVGSEADAEVLRKTLADKDAMSMSGLSGTVDLSSAQPRYADTGWLSDGLSFSITVDTAVAAAAAAAAAKPVESAHRDDGWENNVGADGLARQSTEQEFVQAYVRGLGQTLHGLAADSGIRARVSQSGPTALQITVADAAAANQLAGLLGNTKERELSSYRGPIESQGNNLFRYSDDGWLKHGVTVELRLGDVEPRQVY
jgi:hypothetical protein